MAELRAIALDAFGGDHAPDAIVRGAVDAAVALPALRLLVVGRRTEVVAALKTAMDAASIAEATRATLLARLEVVDAEEVIGMDEHPASAVRAKKDSSLVRACQLVAEGRAGAVVSAGNSGAMLAASLFAMKRIAGVARPAIGAAFPNRTGRTFILDVGGNTDCRPEWLAQFAVMGDVYARTMMGIPQPRVALLSNGEEAEKGSQLVQQAHPMLAALPLRFSGNVEARDLFNGACDVAVCDGFVGNVALKTAEGVAEFLFASIREQASSSLAGKLGGALLASRLRPLKDSVDYRHTGGALLLGVRGEAVIAHGRSDALAIQNAIRVAATAMEHDVSGLIAAAVAGVAAAHREPAVSAGAGEIHPVEAETARAAGPRAGEGQTR
ncbi:MAG: phosphate acyltransferase PlsX [Candidatus Dormibacteria bacterium]